MSGIGPMAAMLDRCRMNLNEYTARAFSLLPRIDRPRILDIGCGTGVPTMELARLSNGTIVAADPDRESLEILMDKIAEHGLRDRITVIHGSLSDLDLPLKSFDILWAEGLLNVAGFETGLGAAKFLKREGFFVIHDECSREREKRTIIDRRGFDLMHHFDLNCGIWRDRYFACLEQGLARVGAGDCETDSERGLRNRALREVREGRDHPESNRSMFLILRLRTDAAESRGGGLDD